LADVEIPAGVIGLSINHSFALRLAQPKAAQVARAGQAAASAIWQGSFSPDSGAQIGQQAG
jgi:hypothetical protein